MRGWRWLGSHGTAGILLGVLALICALGGTLPQSVRLEPEQLRGWQETWGGGWMDSLRLSDIFAAPWFWAVCALLFVNLSVGTVRMLGRAFARRTAALWAATAAHAGLLLLVGGAVASAALGFGAHLELAEGEVWEGDDSKLVTDRGRFNGFTGRIRLDEINAAVKSGKFLDKLHVAITWQESGGAVRTCVITANHPAEIAGYRLYADNTFGYSAVLERLDRAGERRLLLVNFPLSKAQWGKPSWQAEQKRAVKFGGGLLYLQMQLTGYPERLSLTAGKGEVAVYEGSMGIGDTAEIDGERITLRSVNRWAGVYLAADSGTGLVFTGMLLGLAGFAAYLAMKQSRESAARRGGGELYR